MMHIIRKRDKDVDDVAKLSECMALIRAIVERDGEVEIEKLKHKSIIVNVSKLRDDGTYTIVQERRYVKDYARYVRRALEILRERGEIEIVEV